MKATSATAAATTATPATSGVDGHRSNNFECYYCHCFWPSDVDEVSEGGWDEPDENLCGQITRPWMDNTWATGDQRAAVFTCVLREGHSAEGGHAHPEVTSKVFARGWCG